MTTRVSSNIALPTLTTAALSAVATTINVTTTQGWPTPGVGEVGVGAIDMGKSVIELFTYTGKTSTSFTGVVRGVDDTTAHTHGNKARVTHVYSATDLNKIIPNTEKGQPLGVATLDEDGIVPTDQLPPASASNYDGLTDVDASDKADGTVSSWDETASKYVARPELKVTDNQLLVQAATTLTSYEEADNIVGILALTPGFGELSATNYNTGETTHVALGPTVAAFGMTYPENQQVIIDSDGLNISLTSGDATVNGDRIATEDYAVAKAGDDMRGPLFIDSTGARTRYTEIDPAEIDMYAPGDSRRVLWFGDSNTGRALFTVINDGTHEWRNPSTGNVDTRLYRYDPGVLSVDGARIRSVATPQDAFDAANKQYVDDAVGDISTIREAVLFNTAFSSYTLQDGDDLKRIIFTADYQTLTIPADATIAFPDDTEIPIYNQTGHTVFCNPAMGVTVINGSSSIQAQSAGVLKKVSADTWMVTTMLSGSLDFATQTELDNVSSSKVSKTGDTMSGDLYITGDGSVGIATGTHGVGLGVELSGNAHVEVNSDSGGVAYVDLTTVGDDIGARLAWVHSDNEFRIEANGKALIINELGSLIYNEAEAIQLTTGIGSGITVTGDLVLTGDGAEIQLSNTIYAESTGVDVKSDDGAGTIGRLILGNDGSYLVHQQPGDHSSSIYAVGSLAGFQIDGNMAVDVSPGGVAVASPNLTVNGLQVATEDYVDTAIEPLSTKNNAIAMAIALG